MDNTVQIRVHNGIGWMTLNRPRALNALDEAMLTTMHQALTTWEKDPAVRMVVVDSANPEAFCAGGDVRGVRQAMLEGRTADADRFFATEYPLNGYIARYPKPYVALMDGLCMGGGLGISIHGRFRVVTDHTTMAMPETAIGFIPDVGSTYFLNRLPRSLGIYLALTGARLSGLDALYCGLATHYCTRADLPELKAALHRTDDPMGVMTGLGQQTTMSHLADIARMLEGCFGADTLLKVLAKLKEHANPIASELLRKLRTLSPTSLHASFLLLRAARQRPLSECLNLEYVVARWSIRTPDFIEGVRSVLVDKDKQALWLPAQLEDVDVEAIQEAWKALELEPALPL